MPPPLQRQRNTYPHVAQVPECRTPDGAIFAAAEVLPGAEIDWPLPLTGFEGWVEPDEGDSTAQPTTEPTTEADGDGASGSGATDAKPKTTRKSTSGADASKGA